MHSTAGNAEATRAEQYAAQAACGEDRHTACAAYFGKHGTLRFFQCRHEPQRRAVQNGGTFGILI